MKKSNAKERVMDRNRKEQGDAGRLPDRPGLAGQDWEAIESAAAEPDAVYDNGDLRYRDEPTGELPGEDDDNAYQQSDEALADRDEERAMARDLDKTGGRPGES